MAGPNGEIETMKATRSKDGKHRFTIRISHRVGVDDLATLIAYQLAEYGEKITTRRDALHAMRAYLKESGEWNCGSLDDVSRDEYENAKSMAQTLFPELERAGRCLNTQPPTSTP